MAIHRTEEDQELTTTKTLRPGDNVAVKLATNTFWITAVIIRWVAEKSKYEVMDAEDDEENPGTRKYFLPRNLLKMHAKADKTDATCPHREAFFPSLNQTLTWTWTF